MGIAGENILIEASAGTGKTQALAERLIALAEAGVMIFGGCCGTTSAHIAALKEKTAALRLVRPQPQKADLLPCATEKALFFLDPAVSGGAALGCTGLEDTLEIEKTAQREQMDAMESDDPLVTIEIRSPDELEDFADAQYQITKPLCLKCEDAELLELALQLYQGRALYEGPLGEEELKPLAAKYGLIY